MLRSLLIDYSLQPEESSEGEEAEIEEDKDGVNEVKTIKQEHLIVDADTVKKIEETQKLKTEETHCPKE